MHKMAERASECVPACTSSRQPRNFSSSSARFSIKCSCSYSCNARASRDSTLFRFCSAARYVTTAPGALCLAKSSKCAMCKCIVCSAGRCFMCKSHHILHDMIMFIVIMFEEMCDISPCREWAFVSKAHSTKRCFTN